MVDEAPPGGWAALVPELTCSDLASSIYTGCCGFQRCYARPGFAYIANGAAQLMLEQGPSGWVNAPMDYPYGRVINLQIEVAALEPLEARLAAAAEPLFRPPAVSWYRAGDIEHGQRGLLVLDTDGYLLRFIKVLDERLASESHDDA